MKKVLIIACLMIAGFASLPINNFAENEAGAELKLYMGEPQILPINNPTRIVIGNPNIADVINVTKTEMTISPKAVGTTNLMYWDNFGEHYSKVRVLSEDMNEIKRQADSLLKTLNLPGISTKSEDDVGRVVILGNVKTPADRERISVALEPLKDKIIDLVMVKEEGAVVNIDVQVLELSKDATNTLGFSWPGSVTITERGSSAISAAGTKWGTLFKVLNVSHDAFTLTLDALIQEGKARVLSRPRLACQSGKEAELLVGGEKPVFTTQIAAATGGQGTSVEYKEFGIKLNIKPVVTEEKKIKLALNVEVSEVGTAEVIGAANAPTAKAYPLSKRTASTELLLNDGQTLSIGGLIKHKQEEDIRKTAFLGDMPILGMFFRKKTVKVGGGQGERGDTELFIAITPTIVTGTEDLTKKKEETKEKPNMASSVKVAETPADPIEKYASIIQKRILDNIVYPIPAKEAGFQGTVELSLHLFHSGKILDAMVKKSSGFKVLDDNAISVAKGINLYPPFPTDIEQDDLWLEIPVAYQLN